MHYVIYGCPFSEIDDQDTYMEMVQRMSFLEKVDKGELIKEILIRMHKANSPSLKWEGDSTVMALASQVLAD